MAYQPIEDYGVVGNLRTTALIGKNGSIDWFCFPHFDSPSVFGAILDDHKGGYFRILPPSTRSRASKSIGRTPMSWSRVSSPPMVLAKLSTTCRWACKEKRAGISVSIRKVKVMSRLHAVPVGMLSGIQLCAAIATPRRDRRGRSGIPFSRTAVELASPVRLQVFRATGVSWRVLALEEGKAHEL